jgi:hypothetical protein
VSVDVLREVFKYSRSKGVARNVIVALADAAHPDGVVWLPIDPPKDKRRDQTRCLTHRANASRRSVIDSLQELEQLVELEVRKAQRGRSRFSIYRVVVGGIGASEVDYADLPFELDRPFGLGADSAPRQGASERPDEVQFAHDEVQFSGSRFYKDGPDPKQQQEAKEEELSDPAAEEASATDREISELVLALPGADSGSPKLILPLAYGLPRGVFLEAVEVVRDRVRAGSVERPCGLLIYLLRIARAERTAAFSAQLAAQLGPTRAYVPAPWQSEQVKRDEPELYVRLMAKALSDQELRVALAGHRANHERLLELAAAVRAGDEPAAERETPAQARRRWVTRHAATDAAADVAHVIDAWDDVDPVERQELHELATAIVERADTAEAEAA